METEGIPETRPARDHDRVGVWTTRIIVVDDDPEIRALLQRFLGEYGYHVRAVESGAALDGALLVEPADCIVLDVLMPGEDGLSICRRLRSAGDQTPIIMLTARGDPIDRVLGLEMGADDYLPKPFLPRELVARLTAIGRRLRVERRGSREEVTNIGPFSVNFSAMQVTRDGVLLDLTSREYALFAALARSPGRSLSRAQLIERALGHDIDVSDRAIDVSIARLRRAIGDDPGKPRYLRTIWGVGYVLIGNADG
jgi:two-component system, OmpR family, phosphate regulon response regulator OmpR